MSARIWMPLPDRDFEPTEAAIPWRVLKQAGHDVVFTTERGDRAAADPRLLEGVLFGKLGASVDAKAAYAEMSASPEFAAPKPWSEIDPAAYDGLLLPGGHAQGMRQYLDSASLREGVGQFWRFERPVGAICHGVLVLARTRDPATGRSVLAERRTTCLPKYLERMAYLMTFWKLGNYYRTYATYVEDEVKAALERPERQFKLGPVILTTPDARGADRSAFVVEDGFYVSARWPGDAQRFAEKFKAQLEARIAAPAGTGASAGASVPSSARKKAG
jgi:putative intracellular protease/amidase